MPGLVTSHPFSLLVIVTCLIVLAAPARRRINCTRYVFHPVCRGIAAKRSSSASSYSSPSSHSPSSSSSSSSSLSLSPSSSSPRLTEDFISRLMLLTHNDDERIDDATVEKDDEETSSSHNQNQKLQQQQQQLQRLQQHRQQQQQLQQQQQQRPFRGDREDGFVYPYDRYDQYDKELQWKHTLLRVLLMELGSKDFGRQELYGYYPGFDNDDTT